MSRRIKGLIKLFSDTEDIVKKDAIIILGHDCCILYKVGINYCFIEDYYTIYV